MSPYYRIIETANNKYLFNGVALRLVRAFIPFPLARILTDFKSNNNNNNIN